MKWVDGYTPEERWRQKEARLSNWHNYFAWFPVRVGLTKNKRRIFAWLESVRRKGTYYAEDMSYWVWEYKLK
jgi:hypothetical protein